MPAARKPFDPSRDACYLCNPNSECGIAGRAQPICATCVKAELGRYDSHPPDTERETSPSPAPEKPGQPTTTPETPSSKSSQRLAAVRLSDRVNDIFAEAHDKNRKDEPKP